jgi:cysteine desulfurase
VRDGTVYLDHATATPPAPDIVAGIMRALACNGSADALHPAGAEATAMLATARGSVAALIGADPDEVVFTAGATEARNLAVKGLLTGNVSLGRRAVASAIEHPAVMSALRSHARDGGSAEFIGVDGEGYIAPARLATAIDADTALVSIHHAQHEIGTVQDVTGLVAAARDARTEVRIHVDAGESLGVLALDVTRLGADAVTLGGSALGAPAWTGALWIRPGARLRPLVEGGSQESGKRAGAVDLAGAVALGIAAEHIRRHRNARAAALRTTIAALAAPIFAVDGVRLNGPALTARLPGHLQVSTRGVTGESLALSLATRGVYVAPGSTCTADAGKASPTLEAIGLGSEWTHSAILMTAGPATTPLDGATAGTAFADAVAQLRAMSPLDW